SIGQFGADLGALEAASDKGVKTGGFAANGYFTEKGEALLLLQSYGLSEGEKGKGFGQTYKNAYSANIRSTDATVLIGRILNRKEDTDKDLIEIISRYDKPYLVIPKEEVFSRPLDVGEKIAQFAVQNNVQNLNIIGERESHAPGIQNAVREAISETLGRVREGLSERVSEKERVLVREGESEGKIFSRKSSEKEWEYVDNKKLADDNYGSEQVEEFKPESKQEASANKNPIIPPVKPSEQAVLKVARMTEILKAKLQQRPKLVSAILQRGGVKFLENSTHISSSQDKFWNGFGKQSRFIQALSTAYTATVEKEQAKTFSKNIDPVAQSLKQWAVNATFLNRNYVEAINKIQQIYGDTKKPLTENQLKTMSEDSKNATLTKEVKNLVTRLTNTLVQDMREDGSKSIYGHKYILESNENTGFTRITSVDNADVLLSIENNQVKTNKLNHDVYQSLKSAVKAVDEKIQFAQDATGYNNYNSVNNTVVTNQLIK
ncbi:MAG: putative molybdenum carrier protein, partial [Cyanobacteria bacterium P01_A01_bin.68]